MINNVDHGYITGVLLVWDPSKGGGAHWINIVGYNAETDMFSYLDPANPNANDPAQNVREISWADLQEDWGRQIPKLNYQQAMITYE